MTSRNSGFTLLEMLVVIVVMSLILALLAAYGPNQSRWLQTRGAAQSVAAAMTQARGRAIASGQPVTLRLPPEPGWMTVTVTPPAIVFQPDGSASGGTVRLEDAGRGITVSTDWLTARVRIDEK
jgi:general secretion pathway protein H